MVAKDRSYKELTKTSRKVVCSNFTEDTEWKYGREKSRSNKITLSHTSRLSWPTWPDVLEAVYYNNTAGTIRYTSCPRGRSQLRWISEVTNLTKRRVSRLVHKVCAIFSKIPYLNTNFCIGKRLWIERKITHFDLNDNKEFMHKVNRYFPLHLRKLWFHIVTHIHKVFIQTKICINYK